MIPEEGTKQEIKRALLQQLVLERCHCGKQYLDRYEPYYVLKFKVCPACVDEMWACLSPKGH